MDGILREKIKRLLWLWIMYSSLVCCLACVIHLPKTLDRPTQIDVNQASILRHSAQSGWPDEFMKVSHRMLPNPFSIHLYIHNLYHGKSSTKYEVCNFQKAAQSKQLPNWFIIVQSGHPVRQLQPASLLDTWLRHNQLINPISYSQEWLDNNLFLGNTVCQLFQSFGRV
jgi:hypothetical protein